MEERSRIFPFSNFIPKRIGQEANMEITVDVPSRYFLNFDAVEMAQKLKLYSALFMFQAGHLSAGAACEFAGIDRYAFLNACEQHKIPVINYDPDELEEELKRLEEV